LPLCRSAVPRGVQWKENLNTEYEQSKSLSCCLSKFHRSLSACKNTSFYLKGALLQNDGSAHFGAACFSYSPYKAHFLYGVKVYYVAGRMPGHMNVLLAEADIPYDKLYDMDDANGELPQTDISLIIGANDVTNPVARSDKSSPIYGMPILDVDKSRMVMVIKRSMNPGFAGIDNELYYMDKTTMLFGDAKAFVSELVKELSGNH
jgi:hypothetical protein